MLLALLCGSTFVKADILMLKNGTKVEGSILQQNDQGVRMKYKLTPKIMDEKVFTLAEIAQIIKQRPEEVEVIELRKVLPTPDLVKADEYEQIIQDRLRPFVNKYAGTPEAKEVDGIIAKLQEEKTMVSNGQVKLEGKWLSPKESKAETFNVEAFRIVSAMRKKAAKQDYVGALREFDLLMMPRPAYTGSLYFVQAIPETLALLDKWTAVLDKMASEQPQLAKVREDGLSKLQEPDLSRTRNAIADELAKWRAMSDADKRQGIRWVAPYKYELATIEESLKMATEERTRLQTYNLESLKAQSDVYMACYRKIGEGDYAGGSAAFARVQALNLPQDAREVENDLRQRLLKLYGQLVKENAKGAAAASGSAAIGGSVGAGKDSRVAQILAEAGATQPAASSGQPAAAGAMAPAAAAPGATAPAGPAAAPTAGVAPAPVQAAPAQASPVAAAPRPVAAPAPQQQVNQAPAAPMPPPMMPIEPEEESNLQLYVIIGMALVIVGMGLAFLKQKKKSE
jgi:hypothetical protein